MENINVCGKQKSDIDIMKKVSKAFEDNGVSLEYVEGDEVIEIDSLTYMSVVVCIEEELMIDIPVEFLAEMKNISFNSMYSVVMRAMGKRE